MAEISGIIICYNEKDNIEECLRSILWCNEVIVVDAYSTDGTDEIVKRYPVKLFLNKWEGFSAQRKFALTKVINDWVFVLDADERCTPELKEEILKVMGSPKAAGYKIPRKSFFLGKWIKHSGWYPDYKLRLFNRNKVNVSNHLVHERYDIKGETEKLKNDILHYTVTELGKFMEKVNYYSSLSAEEKKNKKRIGFLHLLFRPVYSFLREYVFRLGFLDGVHGLLVAYFNMVTNFLTYSKIWRLQNLK
jgi:glycosyltransferase involved in cell wall biosynthesis